MKRLLVLLIILLSLPLAVNAESQNWQTVIRYRVLDWQTYQFFAVPSEQNLKIESYEWSVDGEHTYYLPQIRYYFEPGEHVVNLRVVDELGNQRSDRIELHVSFWSLQNNQFLWFLYGFLALASLYYWVVVIISALIKRKHHHQARAFLFLLEEQGLREKLSKKIIKKSKK